MVPGALIAPSVLHWNSDANLPRQYSLECLGHLRERRATNHAALAGHICPMICQLVLLNTTRNYLVCCSAQFRLPSRQKLLSTEWLMDLSRSPYDRATNERRSRSVRASGAASGAKIFASVP